MKAEPTDRNDILGILYQTSETRQAHEQARCTRVLDVRCGISILRNAMRNDSHDAKAAVVVPGRVRGFNKAIMDRVSIRVVFHRLPDGVDRAVQRHRKRPGFA